MVIDQQQVDAVTRDYQKQQYSIQEQRKKLQQEDAEFQRQELRLPIPYKPDGAYTMSQDGIDMLKTREKLSLTAYLPTKKDRPTIGYGTTLGVRMGDTIKDEKEAEKLMKRDIKHVEQDYIKRYVKVPLTQYQWDALTNFIYNMPQSQFKDSTLLKVLNNGEYDKVPDEMARWVYQKGKKLDGLINRRKEEIQMWRGKHGK